MKNYHVLLVTLTFGVMVGCAVPAKAANLDGLYTCGNTGLTVSIATAEKVDMFAGVPTNNSNMTISDETPAIQWQGNVNIANMATTTFYKLNTNGLEYFDSEGNTAYLVKYQGDGRIRATLYAHLSSGEWVLTDRSYYCTRK
ncbi:hypothetical protein [Citrobacter braakii]|uniref:hypothetical protein n=1 Tax=Citrobacter braakii TaxID=57706 RepID=UPI0034E55504